MAASRVLIRVRVIPRARANALSVDAEGVVRARLVAPPVDEAANRALVDLLADALDVKRAAFEFARGAHGRDKVLVVHGHSHADVQARLGRLRVDKTEHRG
jgi:uncharacterized protein